MYSITSVMNQNEVHQMCIRHSLVCLKDVDAVTNAPASFHGNDGPAIPDGVDIDDITSILVDEW